MLYKNIKRVLVCNNLFYRSVYENRIITPKHLRIRARIHILQDMIKYTGHCYFRRGWTQADCCVYLKFKQKVDTLTWPTGHFHTGICPEGHRSGLFSELVNAIKKFCMLVNNPLSRLLGNLAKVYLTTCCQSKCWKLKNTNFSRRSQWDCPHIYVCIYTMV